LTHRPGRGWGGHAPPRHRKCATTAHRDISRPLKSQTPSNRFRGFRWRPPPSAGEVARHQVFGRSVGLGTGGGGGGSAVRAPNLIPLFTGSWRGQVETAVEAAWVCDNPLGPSPPPLRAREVSGVRGGGSPGPALPPRALVVAPDHPSGRSSQMYGPLDFQDDMTELTGAVNEFFDGDGAPGVPPRLQPGEPWVAGAPAGETLEANRNRTERQSFY